MAKIKFGKIKRVVAPPKSRSVRKAAAKTKRLVEAKQRQNRGMQFRPSGAAANKAAHQKTNT